MNAAALALRYALFAAAATAVNLATQHAALALLAGLPLAMAAGTLTGLLAKYLLDRRWIFREAPAGMALHVRQFGLYALMGVATTLVFWATELAFEAIFASPVMRDAGAILGLAIGYVTKYQLDRRFVFERREPA